MVPSTLKTSRAAIRIAIDASNIRVGGGVTHLVEILREANPTTHGFERILVWACAATLAKLEDRPWLEKRSDPALEANLFSRIAWQRRTLPDLLRAERADLLFVPGGSIVANFRPVVTMSRNMLPFEWRELKRFGFSPTTAKLAVLRWNQSSSFRYADGTIFLTRYARDAVTAITGPLQGKATTIPHGVDTRFRLAPRRQRAASELTAQDPLRVVYVSTIDEFKHQWHVVDAIGTLHREGIPVRLDLYGSARPSALARLNEALRRADSAGDFIRYHGAVDYREIHQRYCEADISVFASSCENMPNILIESMAAGLPIVSAKTAITVNSDLNGLEFEPGNAGALAVCLQKILVDQRLRKTINKYNRHAGRQYDIAITSRQYLKAYQSLKTI